MTLPHKQNSIVIEMNTLLLVLFFGASVALAELPFENPALAELSDEEGEETTGELKEVENDPFFSEQPSGPPSPSRSPKVKLSFSHFSNKVNLTRTEVTGH